MISRIKRAFEALRSDGQPKTYITSGSSQRNFFSERVRNKDNLKKYETIYNQGGLISEAIDSYAMFALANGWRLEGEDEALVEKVQEQLDYMDFDSIAYSGIVDALVFGDAFQENVLGRGGSIVAIVPRLSSSFEAIHDEYGTISGYKQRIMIEGRERTVDLQPEQIIHLQLIKLGGSVYGQSLLQRAYDEIMRDTKTAESSAVAMERHGFKKFHVLVGKEGENVPQSVLKYIDQEFQDLETKNDFVTNRDVEIKSIDESGLQGMDVYNDVSIMRLCAALGVPEEILGLRRGSTDATASTRTETFFKKVSSIQKRVARCYTMNLIDKLTGSPGAVKIIFNDVSPVDESMKAEWISKIMATTPIDPHAILPKKWVQTQFNIEESDYEVDDGGDVMPPADQNGQGQDYLIAPPVPSEEQKLMEKKMLVYDKLLQKWG